MQSTCILPRCTSPGETLPDRLKFLDREICSDHVKRLLYTWDTAIVVVDDASFARHAVLREIQGLLTPTRMPPVLSVIEGGRE